MTDRALDAKVAEKIFGLAPTKRRIRLSYYELEEEILDVNDDDYDDDDTESDYVVPDLAAAWQVVEHFRQLGWQISIYWDGPRFDAWVVELWLPPHGREGLGANGETAPLAICRATLAAIESVPVLQP